VLQCVQIQRQLNLSKGLTIGYDNGLQRVTEVATICKRVSTRLIIYSIIIIIIIVNSGGGTDIVEAVQQCSRRGTTASYSPLFQRTVTGTGTENINDGVNLVNINTVNLFLTF